MRTNKEYRSKRLAIARGYNLQKQVLKIIDLSLCDAQSILNLVDENLI